VAPRRGRGKQTPPLRRLGELLRLCHELGRFQEQTDATYQDFYLYGDMFFTADYWLKTQGGPTPSVSGGSSPSPQYAAVYRLYVTLVRKLCRSFDVAVNRLPNYLISHFGRQVNYDSAKSDREGLENDTTIYLTRAEAGKYRLFFEFGLVYQYPWWLEERGQRHVQDRVLAESKYAVELENVENFGADLAYQPGRPGSCVMSMSREIYMYQHRGRGVMGHQAGFYHSSYLAGAPVLAAGAMGIVHGKITFINLMSGHYRPTSDKILHFLECLLMHGVPLDGIKVNVWERIGGRFEDNVYLAQQFFQKRGKMPPQDRQQMDVM
jgi:hypothetical protein